MHKDIYNIKKEHTQLNILGVYIYIYTSPPSKSNVTSNNQFADEFLENLQDDIFISDHIIILGDFNVHINYEHVEYLHRQAGTMDLTEHVHLFLITV